MNTKNKYEVVANLINELILLNNEKAGKPLVNNFFSLEQNEEMCAISIISHKFNEEEEAIEIVDFHLYAGDDLDSILNGVQKELNQLKENEKPDSYYDQQFEAVQAVAQILNKTLH